MEKAKKILPVVARMVAQADGLFVESVGPIGFELAEIAFRKWLGEGKTGPSGVRRYLLALSEHLDDLEQRKAFLLKSERLLLQLQLGF